MPVPAALLGKLAVDHTTRGQKLGGLLLTDSLRRVQHLADQIGIRLVMVDASDDAARNFYLHYGFAPLLDDPNRLFMPVSIIRQLGLKPLDEEPSQPRQILVLLAANRKTQENARHRLLTRMARG